MKRRGRTGKGTSAVEAGDDRYSRRGAREDRRRERKETARADEKETAGIPVRDEGGELHRAPQRERDRRETAIDTDG